MSTYENHRLENSTLPFIFNGRTETKRPSTDGTEIAFGSSNWHENTEILLVTAGGGAASDNGHVYKVKAGDVLVFNHNHLHAIAAGEENITYRYLIVDRGFCIANGFDTSALSFSPLIDDEGVRDALEEVRLGYALPEDSPYRELRIRCAVLSLMLLLCEKYSSVDQDTRTERTSAHIKQAIDYISAHYAEDISLDDVAEFAGVSRCHLSREFHKYTGYSFVSYVNRTRCRAARALLADERLTVTEVGRLSGFSNKSYFAKSFKQYNGVLPMEYRVSLRARR